MPSRTETGSAASPSGERPFPRALVRDLQGLVRLLYRVEQDADVPDTEGRLDRLEEAGRAFADALTFAQRAGTGKVPASAWAWVAKGVRLLRELVAGQSEMENLVRVAIAALEKARPVSERPKSA